MKKIAFRKFRPGQLHSALAIPAVSCYIDLYMGIVRIVHVVLFLVTISKSSQWTMNTEMLESRENTKHDPVSQDI